MGHTIFTVMKMKIFTMMWKDKNILVFIQKGMVLFSIQEVIVHGLLLKMTCKNITEIIMTTTLTLNHPKKLGIVMILVMDMIMIMFLTMAQYTSWLQCRYNWQHILKMLKI